MCRYGDEYQRFLDAAYSALAENAVFAEALVSTNGTELIHTIGKRDTRKTVLTEYEFISRLRRCRERLVSLVERVEMPCETLTRQ